MSEVICVAISDPQSCVNRQRTATLGVVESDKPSLAVVTATSQIDISLEYNTKSCIVFNFSKLAILKTQHYVLLATNATQNTVKYVYFIIQIVTSVLLQFCDYVKRIN